MKISFSIWDALGEELRSFFVHFFSISCCLDKWVDPTFLSFTFVAQNKPDYKG